MVASELAASFIYEWLPWIKSCVWTEAPVDNTALLQLRRAACEAFVMQLGLPASYYVYAHVPFLACLDGDKRHKHVLTMLSKPRSQKETYQQFRVRKLRELLAKEAPHLLTPEPCSQKPVQTQAQLDAAIAMQEHVLTGLPHSAGGRAAAVERLAQLKLQRSYYTRREEVQSVLDAFEEREGHDYFAFCLWREAQTDPAFCCVTALNWLPWSANCPEMNMAVEHLNGTIKRFLAALIARHRTDWELLCKGATILNRMAQAVQECGNGEAGLWHIQRSLEKLTCTLEILSEEEGKELILQYVFNRWRPYEHKDERGNVPEDPGRMGHEEHDAAKKKFHEMKATGGKHIPSSKWT